MVFLQESSKKPRLPHVYNQQGHRAVVLSKVSPHHEHGSGLLISPLLSQFVTPCVNPDKDGLVTAALLTLPPSWLHPYTHQLVRHGDAKLKPPFAHYYRNTQTFCWEETLTAWSMLRWTGKDCNTTTIGCGYGTQQPPPHSFWETHFDWRTKQLRSTRDTPLALEVAPPGSIPFSYPPPPRQNFLS